MGFLWCLQMIQGEQFDCSFFYAKIFYVTINRKMNKMLIIAAILKIL